MNNPAQSENEYREQMAYDRAMQAKRKRLFLGLFVGIVVIGVSYFAYDKLVASKHAYTDNAYVGADLALVTPLISGAVKEVLVQDTATVKSGDVLVRIDDTDVRLALARALAEVESAKANLAKTQIDLQRRKVLTSSGSVSGDELTVAENAFSVATANLAVAEAVRDQAQVDMDRTVIRAPVDGIVSRRQVQVGQRIPVGAMMMVIVPINSAYVDANFKEVQLEHVKAGQSVTLESDLYGSKVQYHGKVTGFSGGTGAAFAVVPAQNATGNWIKVVQRLPVRITLDPEELAKNPLRVGLSMTADIHVGD